ncbi:LIM domain containing protein [Acanthamoeba castellanii str. Neff]|uniref:LIM domain containing protein n=1 Tax=Acanthamoeba castellanii (strain ATCC 30010 / Neff) TaxID=1257118 RepID=L8GH12_ACACF|nr:LIM domain containing protein [Acanthamoeba castellanii str. Neff]ELR11486.1 LIM domain containing protein [Acanthamoeba castellanii str. Neff]
MGSPLKKQFNYSSSDLPCAGCQEFFVETDAVVPWGSKEKRWHHHCFVCKGCSAKFELKEDKWMHPSGIAESAAGFPHCGDCYHRLLSVSCDRCKQPIAGAYVDLFGRKFHEECFCCDGCGERLTSSFVKRPAEKKALCRKCVGKQAAGGFVIDPRTGQKKFAT